MFDALNKYRKNGHFFFNPTESLEQACNAPDDKDGVYLVYELKNGRITLVYVGASGDRSVSFVKGGSYGLKQSIIKGPPTADGETWEQTLPIKMFSENIEALDIYWWATYYGKFNDHPQMVQEEILAIHRYMFGELPRWNLDLVRRRK